MKKIIIFENKKTKMRGYRDVPMNFTNSWKVGSTIHDESGKDKCEIIDIVDSLELAKSEVEEYNKIKEYKAYHSKLFFKNRPSLSSHVKSLIEVSKLPSSEKGLSAFNLEIDDINFRNIANSFTIIKVNGKMISAKIVKRKTYNTLTYNYISRYIKEDIKSLEVVLSIVDSGYDISLENREIVLFKNNKEYTLEIIHHICLADNLYRLSKYVALKKRV